MIEALEIGGRKLMTSRVRSRTPDHDAPTLVYLGGLLADQLVNEEGCRAYSLEQEAASQGLEFVRFNFTAHGNFPHTKSTGDFRDITISRMIDDAISVVRFYGLSRVAWIGSSIGAGLLPFLASRATQELKVENKGFFTISGLPPRALAGFIHSHVSEEQRAKLIAGNSVLIESPTLPAPVAVSPEQITDVEKFDYGSIERLQVDGPTVGLAGLQDPVSKVHQNKDLLRVLAGGSGDLQVYDAPHDIPDTIMKPAFRNWMSSLRSG